MFREFTARGKHDWISILPMLINMYNNSKHRTIGTTPSHADKMPTSIKLKRRTILNQKLKFKLGDYVRINTQKGVFTKGYLPNWSTEIFTITKINKTSPPTYMLKDYTGKPIAGCFYSKEIFKTMFPDDYLVEKIIRSRGNQLFVKWFGFDDSHNSWIKANEIRKQFQYRNERLVLLQTVKKQINCKDRRIK
uniref:Uncharacterized transposon-derived protein F54H12.3 n=1 Tax=Sipha flava TaxID=143950 RepID=A0A2S2QG25_9HEMI